MATSKELSADEIADVEAALRNGTPLPSGIAVNFTHTPPYFRIPADELSEIEDAYADERETAEALEADAAERAQAAKDAENAPVAEPKARTVTPTQNKAAETGSKNPA